MCKQAEAELCQDI
jgi:hypothetical protein